MTVSTPGPRPPTYSTGKSPLSQDPASAEAINRLALSGRPLLVVDVDEVVVHMVKPFIPWLLSRGLTLDIESYRLGGNIKYTGTQRTVPKDEVQTLIQAFFDECIHTQEAVDNVAEVLVRLEARFEVVLLTNAPHRHRETRRTSLIAQGITATLITNDGPKGPPVAMLRERALAAGSPDIVVFIDDSPNNIESVGGAVPGVTLIHFIAHPEFRALARDVAGVKLKTGNWLEVERYLDRLVAG